MSIVPSGTMLGNHSPHNFSNLAKEYLQAAEFANAGFRTFAWPTFSLAFQSLELYLKSYLRRHGATVESLKKDISHNIAKALEEAQAKGLTLPVDPKLLSLVKDVSHYYRGREFHYESIGQWEVMLPDTLIAFVHTVRKAVGD